jgi:hypothetical protein
MKGKIPSSLPRCAHWVQDDQVGRLTLIRILLLEKRKFTSGREKQKKRMTFSCVNWTMASGVARGFAIQKRDVESLKIKLVQIKKLAYELSGIR